MNKNIIPVAAILAAAAPVQMNAQAQQNLDEAVAAIQSAINAATTTIEGAEYAGDDYKDLRKRSIDALEAINKKLADEVTANASDDTYAPIVQNYQDEIDAVLTKAAADKAAIIKEKAEKAALAAQNAALKTLKNKWAAEKAVVDAMDPSPKADGCYDAEALKKAEKEIQAAIDAIKPVQKDAEVEANNKAIMDAIKAADAKVDEFKTKAANAQAEYDKYLAVSAAVEESQVAYNQAIQDLVKALGNEDVNFIKAQAELTEILKVIKSVRDENNKSYTETGKTTASFASAGTNADIAAIVSKYSADRNSYDAANTSIASAEKTFTDFQATLKGQTDFQAVKNAIKAVEDAIIAAKAANEAQYAAQSIRKNSEVADAIEAIAIAQDNLEAVSEKAQDVLDTYAAQMKLVDEVVAARDKAVEAVAELKKKANDHVEEYNAADQFANTETDLNQKIDAQSPLPGYENSVAHSYDVALAADKEANTLTKSQVEGIDWDKASLLAQIAKYQENAEVALKLYIQAGAAVKVHEAKYAEVEKTYNEMGEYSTTAFDYTPSVQLEETLGKIREEIDGVEAELKDIMDVNSKRYEDSEGKLLPGTERDAKHFADLKGIDLKVKTITDELTQLKKDVASEKHDYDQTKLKYLVDREHELVDIKMAEMNTLLGWAAPDACQGHACYAAAKEAYKGVTDSIAKIQANYGQYPAVDTSDRENYKQEHLDMLLDLLKAIDSVIGDNGLNSKFQAAETKAKAEVKADGEAYTTLSKQISEQNSKLSTLGKDVNNPLKYNAAVKNLHTKDLSEAQATIIGLKEALEVSKTAHTVRTDRDAEGGYNAQIAEITTTISKLKTELEKDQKNYKAHAALTSNITTINKDYTSAVKLSDSNKWIQFYKEELAKQKEELDKVEKKIGEFNCDCTCDADQNVLTEQLAAIQKKIKGLDAENKANADKYAEQQKAIDEVQERWNSINDLINTNKDWDHPEKLADALKEMAGYQIELNDIKEGAEENYLNGQAAKTSIDLDELAKNINSVPNKLMGTYIAAVDADNEARYNQFKDAIKDTQDAFNNAITVADELRGIDGLSESATTIATEAANLHDVIFGFTSQIRQLVDDAREDYIGTDPKNDERDQPNIYDEEGYEDESKSYKAQAENLTNIINQTLDNFYTTVDEMAKDVIDDEAVKAADKIWAAGTKIDRLNVDEDIRANLFTEASDLIDAEKKNALDAEHPSEALTDYLDAMDGKLNEAITNGLNTAAACDIEHFFENVDKAIAKYKEDIEACEALTDVQKNEIEQKYQEQIADKYAAAKADFETSKKHNTTFDDLDAIKAILDGYQYVLDDIVADAQQQNSDNIADAANTAAYDRMVAAAQKLAEKCEEVLNTIENDCADVAADYVHEVLMYQNIANELLTEKLPSYKAEASARWQETYYQGGYDTENEAWTGCDRYGSIQYYYNLTVSVESQAKSAEKYFASDAIAKLNEDIKALEEQYNKIASLDWEDGEPDEYKAEIDAITEAVNGVDTTDGIDAAEIAVINKAKEDIAKEYTKLADVLNAEASATAYKNLTDALNELQDLIDGEKYDERISELVAANLESAHNAVEALTAAVEASKANGTITYDEKTLADKIETAKNNLYSAEANAQAETNDWAASDAQYNANKEAIDNVKAVLDEVKKLLAGYNQEVQDIYGWELSDTEDVISDYERYNVYVLNDKENNSDYTWIEEPYTERLNEIAAEARAEQAGYDNRDAYYSLYNSYSKLSNKYDELYNLVASWSYRAGYNYDDIKHFGIEIESVLSAINESYDEEMADDNEADIKAAIDEIDAALVDAIKSENAAIQAWKDAHHYRKGDVNRDGDIDILDYGKVASWILNGMDTKDAFEDPIEFDLANTDNNSTLNTSDLQGIVNQIKLFYKNGNYTTSYLAVKGQNIGADKVTVVNNNGQLAIGVDNSIAYTGFQMDITLPSGASIENIALTARANGQSVSFNNLGGDTYRVLVMGIDGEAFNGNSGALINIATSNLHGTVGISNIHFTDQMANSYSPALAGEATAIEGVMAEQTMTEKIYSVGGQLLNKAQKGVNIIMNNGVVKKVLNK